MAKNFGYWNNKENCIKESQKYNTITELKDNSVGCYSSILRNNWETECFPNFIKRKPNGYWDNKELCIKEAKKYRNLKEFQMKCYSAYKWSKKNYWIDEINLLYDKTILYHSYEERIHSVYVYEIKNKMVCYVGRTNNIRRRNGQHKRDINDSINKYCISNRLTFPKIKILKEKLTAEESQYYEDFFLKEYIRNGWKSLNTAMTGVNKGSLGAICKWTYDKCSEEARKYKTIIEFEKGNQSAYRAAMKNGWLSEFLSASKRNNKYWDDYGNCRKAFEDCKDTRELIKKYGGCYNGIRRNHFDDLKYNRNKNEIQ